VHVELPTLKQQAVTAATLLWDDIQDTQVVVWVDNWYVERYTTNPDRCNVSTNVTAFAVLPLHSTAASASAVTTRSRHLPPFPGHLTLHMMCIRVDGVAASVALRLLLRDAGHVLLMNGVVFV
jgi:hypothetical protein